MVAIALVKKRPYLAVGWFWFVGTLVPVIGLVQVGEQALADRYTYLPLIGVFIILAWGAVDLTQGWPRQSMVLNTAAMAVAGRLPVSHDAASELLEKFPGVVHPRAQGDE